MCVFSITLSQFYNMRLLVHFELSVDAIVLKTDKPVIPFSLAGIKHKLHLPVADTVAGAGAGGGAGAGVNM